MNKKPLINRIPFGIIFGVSLMVLSLLAVALVAVNIVSSEMIKTVGGDDGLIESWWVTLLYVLTIVIGVIAIASITFVFIRKAYNAKNNIREENKYRSISVCFSSYFVALFIISMVVGVVANGFAGKINAALGLTGYRTETIESDEEEDLEYFKSDYVKKDDNGNPLYVTEKNGYKHQVYDDDALAKAALKKADQVQREGTTILWNNSSNGLPLAKNSKVSLLSHSSVDWVYSGGGSGYAYTTGASNMKTALTNAGLSINNTLWDFYSSGGGSSYKRTARYLMNEVPWSQYTSSVISSFSSYGDAAIITLSRQAGEGSVAQGGAFDVTTTGADTPNGDYYDMSYQERTLLNEVIKLKNSGTFKKVVVLLNTPTGMWFDNLLAHKNDIDACVWVCQTGFEGLNEVGKILVGDSVPSGHLADTFLYNTQADPAFINSVYSTFTNANAMGLKNVDYQGTYIAYLENIYVGYKYYETRYEDAVLGKGYATSTLGVKASSSNWKYSEEVAFPFGFGESYTTFAYSDFSVTKDGNGDFVVSTKVTNTGSVKGKDAVQVYLQKPYTQYDRDNGIEQASVNLVGYDKTKELNPGESVDVNITVKAEYLKTYDANNKKTYIREKTSGNDAYYLTAACDAHVAINNILAAKGKTPANTSGVMDHEGDSSFVYKIDFNDDDFVTYSKSLSTNYPITNQFDDTDWNKYEHKTETNVTYLSRNNWRDTYPTSSPALTLNDDMVYDLSWNKEVEKKATDKMPTYGKASGLTLIDLKGIDFDSPTWNALLDTLTLEEQINFLGNAYKSTLALPSIGKPADIAADGPLGIRMKYLGNGKRTLSYPCAPLLAASYNDKLAKEVGELMGEDMIHAGVNCLYGPGANIHRTTYAGRNYEYYSEDGFLSGRMLKEHVEGIQSIGCYVNVKHFALNDQESNRYGVGIWANEQSIRDIYLAAFEYSVREGACTGLMSAFNRFGTLWSGAHKGLCTNVLRNEWGFKGFVISDCAWRQYMGVVDGVMAGNDCILDDAINNETASKQYNKAKDNPTIALAIREATHRILYVVANSNVMNGISSNTRIYLVNEWWQDAVVNVQIVLAAVAGTLLLATILIFVFYKKIKKKYDKRMEVKEMRKQQEIENQNGSNVKLNGFEKLLRIGQPWDFKRILITLFAITLSLGLIAGSFFAGYAVGKSGSPSEDQTPVDPVDPGTDTRTAYIFEAECADLVTTIETCGKGIESGKTLSDVNNPHGDAYVYNLSKTGEAELTFYIYSSANDNVSLSLRLGLNTARNLSTLFTYTINGNNIPYEDKEIPDYTTKQYFEWTTVEVANFDIQEGNNILKLTKTTWGLNFDYLSLKSSATLMDSREHDHGGHSYGTVPVTHSPTLVAEGLMDSGYCEYCRHRDVAVLPTLSEANGYTKTVITPNTDTEFGSAKWSITKFGQNLEFESVLYPNNAKSYLFEAEKATFDGSATRYNDTTVNASGNAYLGKLAGATWTITFNIDANEACEALLYMRIGRRNDRDVVLSSGKTLTLNNNDLSIPTSVVFHQIESDSKYMNWEEYEIMKINLDAGQNTLVFANNGSAFTNLDYFRFVSVGTLSWTVIE